MRWMRRKTVKPFGRGLDAAGCDTLCRMLGGRPETVIAVHQLRRGLCSAYLVGEPSRPDAAVIQPTRLPEEPMAFGTDAGAIWSVLGGLTGCHSVVSLRLSGRDAGMIGPDRSGGTAAGASRLVTPRLEALAPFVGDATSQRLG
jgi:hypothetical protein